MQYLQSDKPACGSFLDLAPYRDVIGLFASPEVLSRLLLDAVDPTIRALQNLTITRARLDEARATQIEGSQSWGQNSGYLDYVTDCRTPDYWRSYVGQSHNTPERITQHIREIRSGASHTLHYFVIKSGGGHRVANFMKLWTLVLPENFDPIIEDVLTNLLEMAMARSF
ncbi:hypothetical protein N8T08_003740 [Aspergillus melleus]|uniref:Uncharacterized protein n=1 Tax=Aspergillus melleus TaxID=138277 RepID=A0ACC3B6G5_9EURO|nr:hypothetical protein N8T08_003740 [Aspergillus melleus]